MIASDGLWDVCDDQKAVDLCKGLEQANTMASTLVKYAKMNGSKDNVSVMVLKFWSICALCKKYQLKSNFPLQCFIEFNGWAARV